MVDELLLVHLAVFVVLPAAVGIWISTRGADALRRRATSPLLVRSLRIAVTIVWIALVVVGLSVTLGPFSIFSTLTVSAIASIALTLALQTTLQNIIAGFLLLQDRSLRMGDQIQFGGIKGTVVGLGLVTTVLRTADGTLAFVSNSNLLSGPILNTTATARFMGEF